MNDENKNLWDVRIAIGSFVISILTVIVGGATFFDSEVNKVRLEHQLVLYHECADYYHSVKLQRLETYDRMSDVVANIASAPDEKSVGVALVAYRKLYYGRLLLVDDPDVREALKRFLDDGNLYPEFVALSSLKNEAVSVGSSIRESIVRGGYAAPVSFCGPVPSAPPLWDFIRAQ